MAKPVFSPEPRSFWQSRVESHYTAICGLNNSGKSLLLKNIKRQLGKTAYMMGAQRFYHLYHISTQMRDTNVYDQFETQFNNQFDNEQFNYEQNFMDLGRIITNLNDANRKRLLDLCTELTGNKFTLEKVEADNELSMRFIGVDRRNLAVSSTGTRLLITMLGLCMDQSFSHILIDEPEMGLAPALQANLANFLADKDKRAKYFPHLKGILVATHSHLFLDRRVLGNNFFIQREDGVFKIKQVSSFAEFHTLQFNLLGNSLETLFLPSAFVIVEGKTDKAYLEKCIGLRIQGTVLVLVSSDPKAKVHELRNTLGDLAKSPFYSRIFVVLDSAHTKSDPAALAGMGVKPDNIIIWDRNGIEYLYPASALASIFSCSPDQVHQLSLDGDEIALNGLKLKKAALNDKVVALLQNGTELPSELEEKLIAPLRAAIS